jgi:hypothetical protein
VFRFHDLIEYSIQLRSMHHEILGALCLVQNFRKLTEIQSSEVFRLSGDFQEKEYKHCTQLYSMYSGVLVHFSTGLLVLGL